MSLVHTKHLWELIGGRYDGYTYFNGLIVVPNPRGSNSEAAHVHTEAISNVHSGGLVGEVLQLARKSLGSSWQTHGNPMRKVALE